MRFHNRLCKRKAKTEALGILGKAASIKPLENVIQVLGMYAAAVISYGNLDNGSKGPPFDMNRIARFRMVQGIFDKIADSLDNPAAVAQKGDLLAAGQTDFLSLLLCAEQKMLPDVLGEPGYVFQRFFQYKRTGIQLCDFQKALHQRFYAVQLPLGKAAEFLYGRQAPCLVLYEPVVNIESGKRRF